MKKSISLCLFIALCLTIYGGNAQTDKPKIDVVKKAEDRVYQAKDRTSTNVINKPIERVEAAADKAVDKILDKDRKSVV